MGIYISIHIYIFKLPFNLSHMPEPRLVPHPKHLGAIPGSATGSGRALEHDVGDSVGSCCPQHALSPPTLGSTNVHEKVAPVFPCVSSVTLCGGVNHRPTPWPAPSHHTQLPLLLGPVARLSRAQGSFVSFACAFGVGYPRLVPTSSKMQLICSLFLYIYSMKWKTSSKSKTC